MEPARGSRAGGPTPGGGAWGAPDPAARASEPRTERPRALAVSFPLAPTASGPCPASRPHQPAAPRMFLNQKKRDIKGESGLSGVQAKLSCPGHYLGSGWLEMLGVYTSREGDTWTEFGHPSCSPESPACCLPAARPGDMWALAPAPS